MTFNPPSVLMKKYIQISFVILLVALALISCRKSINDFQPGMTKHDVIEAWGDKCIKTFFTSNEGKVIEVWRYNFRDNYSYILFDDDKIIATHYQQHDGPVDTMMKYRLLKGR